MKIVTRGIELPYTQRLKDRGHVILNANDIEVAVVLNQIAGCNVVIFDADVLLYPEDAFYFGAAAGLAKDIVVITDDIEGFWSEVPSVSKFASFDEFFAKVEEGVL